MLYIRKSHLLVKLSSDVSSDKSVNEISAISNGIRQAPIAITWAYSRVLMEEDVLTFRVWVYLWFIWRVRVRVPVR